MENNSKERSEQMAAGFVAETEESEDTLKASRRETSVFEEDTERIVKGTFKMARLNLVRVRKVIL